ncbi:MAG: hypothetical protein KKE01_02030, partial [Candidatus Omnitrophica bacterium]|nr:hypothetical protein [Candidatus Omnitrophota bacterium]
LVIYLFYRCRVTHETDVFKKGRMSNDGFIYWQEGRNKRQAAALQETRRSLAEKIFQTRG